MRVAGDKEVGEMEIGNETGTRMGSAQTNLPRVIVLDGSPTEIGFRHGQAMRDEIRFLTGQLDRFIFSRIGGVKGAGLRVVAHTLAGVMNRHSPEHLRREMGAVAEGSGVGYSRLLLMNALDDVLNILRRLSPQRTSPLACSSFALFGARSWDEDLIHGRNLDYHFRGTPLDDRGEVARLLQRHAVMFVFRPRDRAGFVSISWPGVVGVTTALTGNGISLGNLTSYLRGTTPRGVPSGLLYRQIAEEATGLADVARILRASPRTVGYNLMAGSGRENSAALFEITMDTVAEVSPRDGALAATNHFVTPFLAERQRPYLLAHSVTRWKRLRSLVEREGTTLEEAMGYLADVRCNGGGECESPFARVANEGTAVSVLFRPVQMEMWVGMSEAPPASLGEFRPVDVTALLSRG
jgi:hypothetical protein